MRGFGVPQVVKDALDRFRFGAAARSGGDAGGLYRKSDYGVWAEAVNPLRGLTADRARDIFDTARRGVYSELAWLYQEIEAADPLLFVCAERREAAAGAADWRIALRNPDRTAGWDDALAEDQQAFLSAAIGAAGDEVGALAEHLARGFFRGFAHARPLYEGDALAGFEALDQWNFAREPGTGAWWWNPDASRAANERFALVPDGELVTLERSRHIDYPALLVFLRAALGERKWGIFLERYGIPPVTVIMPEFAEKSEQADYMEAASKLARAGSGALPFGSTVSYATDARGTNPFESFLRHQQELVVLMSTGGLLTTLSAPGSGTLAGGAHEETWRSVVGRDLRAVARTLNRTVVPRLLARKFPDKPALAMFEFSTEPAPSSTEVFEDAGKARAAGYRVDLADLEERTGYKLVLDPQNAPAAGLAQASWVANKPDTVAKRRKPVAKRADGSGRADAAPGEPPPGNGLEEALAAVLAAVERGASVDEALAAYDRAAAEAITAERIAAAAEPLAEEMEAAAAAEAPSPAQPAQPAEQETDR